MERIEFPKMIEEIISQNPQKIQAAIKDGTTDILVFEFNHIEKKDSREEVTFRLSVEVKFDIASLSGKIDAKWRGTPIADSVILGVISQPFFIGPALDLIQKHSYDELADFVIQHRGAGLAKSIDPVF